MLSHFLRAVIIQRSVFNVLREYGTGETPQALKRLSLQSTDMYKTANN
ncbi:hypothetical protein [Neobacillus sp. 204]